MFEYDNEEYLKIVVNGGYLRASVASDVNYPGIDVEYISFDDNEEDLSRPRILVEYPYDGELRALIWNNPAYEDYTKEIKLK